MAGKNTWIDNVGHLYLSSDEKCFWLFPTDFFLDKKLCITSPWFSYIDETWRFVKMPSKMSTDFVSFHVWRKITSNSRKCRYYFSLSLEALAGTPLSSAGNRTDSEFGVDFENFCSLSALVHHTISRCGLTKLFFNAHKIVSTSDNLSSIRDDGTNVEENELKTESDEVEKTEETEAKGVERLVQNLKQLFLSGQNSDAVLEVDGKEFQVHKAILSSRSPVFASMFQHDTIEKKSGIVNIPDCTAESFEAFLLYLYTGSVDTMSSNNVYNLYYAADKYRIDDLKEECVEYMISILSVDTFCDVIALSIRHGESKLQKEATGFFRENIKKIIKTVQWQKYMSDNTTHANELLIKALNA